MAVIPGKYVDGDGEELTVIGAARHGATGERMVIYRAADGGMRVLTEEEWAALDYTYAAELELKSYLAGGSRTELAKRLYDMFPTRGGVYSLHWRSVIGAEGYNYACENHGSVPGCRRGVDSCKNCRAGWRAVFSEETAARHLAGELTAGFYPIAPDGTCRFLVFEPGCRERVSALRGVCADYDIPASCEVMGRRTRLWIFFAEGIAIGHLRRLGRALVTLALERLNEAAFDMYDRFVPCRGELLPEDMGFELTLPFGRYGKDAGYFADESFEPLPYGPAELFRVKTVTKGYLSDRLSLLGEPESGPPWGPARKEPPLPEGARLCVQFDGCLKIKKDGLPPEALRLLRRLACVKNHEPPYGEFEPLSPSVSACFSEDGQFLRLPRGLRQDLESLSQISRWEMTVDEALPEHERVYMSLRRDAGEAADLAAKAMAQARDGILLAPLGWGKTAAAVRLIEQTRLRTLIITADEMTRQRWVNNILEYFGIDAERSSSKIHVRTAGDRRIKDRYGLVLLADCSRLPIDEESFARISGLRPAHIYGITASDRRRDGKWGLIHMLCGSVVYTGE